MTWFYTPDFPLQSISTKISCRGLDLDQAGGRRVAGAVSWSVGPSVTAQWLPAPRSQAPSCDRGSSSSPCPRALCVPQHRAENAPCSVPGSAAGKDATIPSIPTVFVSQDTGWHLFVLWGWSCPQLCCVGTCGAGWAPGLSTAGRQPPSPLCNHQR